LQVEVVLPPSYLLTSNVVDDTPEKLRPS